MDMLIQRQRQLDSLVDQAIQAYRLLFVKKKKCTSRFSMYQLCISKICFIWKLTYTFYLTGSNDTELALRETNNKMDQLYYTMPKELVNQMRLVRQFMQTS